MAEFVKGDIVVIPSPFSDLSGSKRRPALVLTDLPGEEHYTMPDHKQTKQG
jgi:mRNA interferase MazF